MLRRLRFLLLWAALCLIWAPRGVPADAARTSPALRLVATGTLEKAGGGYILTEGTGKATYAVQAGARVDLNRFVGRQVQVTGRLETESGTALRRIVAEQLKPTETVAPAYFAEVKDRPSVTGNGGRSDTVPLPLPLRGNAAKSPGKAESGTTAPATSTPVPLLPPAQSTIITEGDAAFLDSGEPVPQGYELQSDGLPPQAETPTGPAERLFVQADYLTWWTKGMALPPLVTTSPAGTPQAQAGVLGVPGTSVLCGDDKVLDGDREGLRLRVGGWLGKQHRVGIEAEYLKLERASLLYHAGSNGLVILARPFTNVDPALGAAQGPDAALIAYPNLEAGNVDVAATSRFEAWAFTLRCNLLSRGGGAFDQYGNPAHRSRLRLDLLSGYRDVQLKEALGVHELLTLSVTPQAGLEVSDQFATENHFQGGELGLSGSWQRGRLSLDGLVRLALGRTEQRVAIAGTTWLSTVGIVTEMPGGVLAQTTNSGTYRQKQTDIVPELGATLGFMLSPRLKLNCGYSLIYWPHVVRPGEQIDLTVNGSYIPDPTITPSGPLRPSFAFRDTSYWAHGLNVGLDYRW